METSSSKQNIDIERSKEETEEYMLSILENLFHKP